MRHCRPSALMLVVVFLAAWIESSLSQWNHRERRTKQSDTSLASDDDISVLKLALKSAQQALLEDIESLESSLDQQISDLQHRKSQVALRKRTHRKCMVHLISCYKK